MKFLPILPMLLALVVIMGGLGRDSFEATGRMILTIVGLVVFFVLFYLVVARAL